MDGLGYALVFDTPSTGLRDFHEVIHRGALDGVLEQSDVFALLDHNQSRGVLARSNKGTGSLTLSIDERGLKYSFEVPDTALGAEVYQGVQRGDIAGSSFSFTVKKDRWERGGDGVVLRHSGSGCFKSSSYKSWSKGILPSPTPRARSR